MEESKLNRHAIREKAIQSLFQLQSTDNQHSVEEVIDFALEAGNDPNAPYSGEVDQYLHQLVLGVQNNKAAIDELIMNYLSSGWTLDRLASIDLTILRLAFYEVLFEDETQVPNKVAVNEAIELSKTFSDEKSRKFISGVLAQLLENHQ